MYTAIDAARELVDAPTSSPKLARPTPYAQNASTCTPASACVKNGRWVR